MRAYKTFFRYLVKGGIFLIFEFSRFPSTLEKFTATPVLVQRAASFNEAHEFDDKEARVGFGFTAPHRYICCSLVYQQI